MSTINGTITRLVSDKGFGFVASGEGSEYFFHRSGCNGVQFDDLREGQAVTFEKGEDERPARGKRQVGLKRTSRVGEATAESGQARGASGYAVRQSRSSAGVSSARA